MGVGVRTGSTRHVGHFWPIVPAPCDCEDGEFGGMKIGRGNRSTRRKPAPEPLCPPHNPTWPDPDANPGRRCAKPATNRSSYGRSCASCRRIQLPKLITYLENDQKCSWYKIMCMLIWPCSCLESWPLGIHHIPRLRLHRSSMFVHSCEITNFQGCILYS
jgi:hypothetical protein